MVRDVNDKVTLQRQNRFERNENIGGETRLVTTNYGKLKKNDTMRWTQKENKGSKGT